MQPLNLPEYQRVRLSISDIPDNLSAVPDSFSGVPDREWLDLEFMRACSERRDEPVSLDEVRRALSAIPGNLTEDIRRERDER